MAKRWLYLTHRWVGIVTCLLFAMWFVSGLVMVYVPFPALSGAERLRGLAPIDWAQVRTGPGEAAAAAIFPEIPRSMTLEMRGDRPVWRVTPWDGEEIAVSARDGALVAPAGRAEAARIAALFGGAPVRDMRLVESDQWTVPGSFDRHRPLWKAQLEGPGGRILYVSSRTGAVVLDTNAQERFWNWLGSVPHWLYPRALREHPPAWRQVVLWSSGPCIIGAIAGVWIGVIRVRAGKRRFKGGRMTPYHGWMKWHHIAGLIGSLFLIGWIFSGWLSVDPGRYFATGGIAPQEVMTYTLADVPAKADMAALAAAALGAKRITLSAAAGKTYLRVEESEGRERLLDPVTFRPFAADEAQVRAAAAGLMPGHRVAGIERLTAPDAYWYAVNDTVKLPVLRVRFDDPAETWVHIDPASGAMLGGTDTRGRLYRWLFDLLHRWDLNLLLDFWPARDIVIWLFSIAGIVTSATGIWVGWKRLVR